MRNFKRLFQSLSFILLSVLTVGIAACKREDIEKTIRLAATCAELCGVAPPYVTGIGTDLLISACRQIVPPPPPPPHSTNQTADFSEGAVSESTPLEVSVCYEDEPVRPSSPDDRMNSLDEEQNEFDPGLEFLRSAPTQAPLSRKKCPTCCDALNRLRDNCSNSEFFSDAGACRAAMDEHKQQAGCSN